MLVVNPAYGEVSEDWFDPERWGARAHPVATGGRGGAWFIASGQGAMVLRHYRRGGLIARVSEKSYIYTGQSRTRSFREFHLLKTLYDLKLPVPEPVAAWAGLYRGLWYHAAILIRRIDNAVPFPDAPDLDDEELWRRVGQVIRSFHDVGLDHVDLNCDNILVSGDDVFLIDFDRCRFRAQQVGNKWKQANLDRMWRSVVKRVSNFTETQRESLWKCLVEGYYMPPQSSPEAGKSAL